MKQAAFEQNHQKNWSTLEQLLNTPKAKANPSFPQHYRELCNHLALAKHRRYSTQLIDYLNELVTQGHHYLYQHNYRYQLQWLNFLVFQFPSTIRRNGYFVGAALALFFVPLLVMAQACYINSELIYSIMGHADVNMMEEMYDPSNHKLGRERDSATDIYMFGYYIKNNIGIGFRTFAGGIIYGIGSIFFLVYNGIFIGATAGHLTQLGYGATFYPFIAGHGSFELIAIALSGAAGLKLGYALIRPGPYSIKNSLRFAAKDAIIIMYGVIAMLLIAAFIEAFWSSTTSLPTALKYAVGIIFWALHLIYFIFSGRKNEFK